METLCCQDSRLTTVFENTGVLLESKFV